MAEQENFETFIDADSGFTNEKNSYENLILKQMMECAKVLSREMTGGQIMHKETKTGTEKYIEDVRELVINHVDTLRMLLCTYIRDNNKKQLDAVIKEINDYKKKIGEAKILVPGKGYVLVGDFKGLNVDSPHWKDYINFKAMKYRDIFEILMSSYNDQKAAIRQLEEE